MLAVLLKGPCSRYVMLRNNLSGVYKRGIKRQPPGTKVTIPILLMLQIELPCCGVFIPLSLCAI